MTFTISYLTKTANSKTNRDFANLQSFRFLGKQHKAIAKVSLLQDNSPQTFNIFGKLANGNEFSMNICKETLDPRAFFINNKKIK